MGTAQKNQSHNHKRRCDYCHLCRASLRRAILIDKTAIRCPNCMQIIKLPLEK